MANWGIIDGYWCYTDREATVDAEGRRIVPSVLDQLHGVGEVIGQEVQQGKANEAASQGENSMDRAKARNDGAVQVLEGIEGGIKGEISAQIDDAKPQKVDLSTKSQSRKQKDWSILLKEGSRKSLRIKK